MTERFQREWPEGPAVRGELHRPEDGAPRPAIALTHGASSSKDAPLLVALAEAFAEAEWIGLRYDLPYRQARPGGPPSPSASERDREGIRKAAQALADLTPGAPVLGGHSYGGRQTSMVVAEQPTLARALLLLSYPLHPPGKPEKARTAHLPGIRIPVLFVHGTGDAFATPEELQEAAAVIPAPVRFLFLEGAGHSLVEKRQGPAAFQAAALRIRDQFLSFLRECTKK